MPRELSRKDIEILEQRGLHKASSYISRVVRKLTKKKHTVNLSMIKQAHRIFMGENPNEVSIAGKYRRDNDITVERMDDSGLRVADWRQIPNKLAEIQEALDSSKIYLKHPATPERLDKLVSFIAGIKHKFTVVHPFKNGNGRASRLLAEAILLRAGLSKIILDIDKNHYRKAMLEADKGNMDPLREFILHGLTKSEEEMLKAKKRKRREAKADEATKRQRPLLPGIKDISKG